MALEAAASDRRVVHDRWSLLTRQVAMVAFVVCVLTGAILMFWYDPTSSTVRYQGSHAPLQGVEMSGALASTLDISFDVRGGLLVRQLHHWTASVMIAALMLHILRIFFTGGFRRPRRLGWVLLFGILFASMGAGLSGMVLPDDLLSGSSLAVLDGVLKSVPIVGTWLSGLLFQGRFPSGALATFYPAHVLVLPLAMIGLGVVLLRREARQNPPIAGRNRTATVARWVGLFGLVSGALTLVAGFVTVNPVWAFGPADPANATAGAAAPWYMAFLDGAQRLVPPGLEVVWAGRTWTLALLLPLGVVGLFLTAAVAYPFVEEWASGDRGGHRGPTQPRSTPTRTALGAAGVTFYGVLWAAAGSDFFALIFALSLEDVVLAFQIALVLGPVSAFVLTRRVCLELQLRDRDAVLRGSPTGRMVRLPSGGFIDVHEMPDGSERRGEERQVGGRHTRVS
ncbi:hypothetical protein N802_03855 [Knoellia sinensis KCTC 19936]|uniref:Cytochrome bc1 complex cytochrome b subunit n=1 Tax=Knoellia sinensis KCTC 19936 TaxID=1385520 RepID=A0A0A0J655_9MICO|nr:cytochrome b N-terminal domain-containing protein [Knoellia sinensis]KGN31512.1 hypothetical protein N802_03855 [Knoellia sinensis KCTC 19936]